MDDFKERLLNIKELEKNATPGPWTGQANYPFYACIDKPAPSLSKHDAERPNYWRIEDVKFVVTARTEVPMLIEKLEQYTERDKFIKEFITNEYVELDSLMELAFRQNDSNMAFYLQGRIKSLQHFLEDLGLMKKYETKTPV